MDFNFIQKSMRKNFGATLMQLALVSSPLSMAAANTAYYSSRRGSYGRNGQYLVDEAIGNVLGNALSEHALRLNSDKILDPGVKISAKDLAIVKSVKVRELVIVDQNIKDSHLFQGLTRTGVEIIQIKQEDNGLDKLIEILAKYEELDAVHLFSHASPGKLLLGNEEVDRRDFAANIKSFQAINKAIKSGGDFLLYGCELAKGDEGQELLEIIKGNTHVDLAASVDKTGNIAEKGDWDLEITKGDIDAKPLANSIALKDFTGLLAFTGNIDFSNVVSSGGFSTGAGVNASVSESGYTLVLDGQTESTYAGLGRGYSTGAETTMKLYFTNNEKFDAGSIYLYNLTGYNTQFNISSNLGAITTTGTINSGTGSTINLGATNTSGINYLKITLASGSGYFAVDDFAVANLAPNAAPAISNLNGDSFTYNEGDGDQAIDQSTAAVVTDADNADFDGGNLTVTISSGEDASEDILTLLTSGTISLAGTTAGSNVSESGTVIGTLGNNIAAGNDLVVNFNANSTLARVQKLVQAIAYSNSDTDNPTTGTRTVRVTVNDGSGGTSTNNDVTITVARVNDDPAITGLPTDITVTEDVASNVDLSAVTFTDVDAGGGSVTLTIAAGAGTLAASSAGGVTISGSGTGTITLTGTASNIDTYLNTASNIKYTSALNANGNDATTLTLTANDGGNTGSGGGANVALGTVNIDITAVNDAPTLTSFSSAVDNTNANTEVEISFADLAAQGNEQDVDGTVDAFIVQAVSTGTLKIGTSAGTATAFNATTNNRIDATNQGYWTPATDATGTLNAFTTLVEDNSAALSTGAVQVTVSVTAVGEINVTGNGNSIADGDTSPNSADDTDFGNANINGGTVSKIFTIENSGTANLTLSGTPVVAISGANAADFTVTAQPVSTSIGIGSSTTFTVEFDPSGLGVRTATISIDNDDPDENPYNFDIQGTGVDSAGAVNFDGVDDYVTIGNGGALNDLQSGTIEMWVKWSGIQDAGAAGFGHVLGRQKNSVLTQQVIGLNGNDPATAKVTWSPYSASVELTSTTAVGDGVWTHVAVTYKSGEHKLYLNGNLEATSTVAGTIQNDNTVAATIGAWIGDGSGYMKGEIDEVRFWSTLRTQAEIQNTLNCELLGTEPGLAGYYKFNNTNALAGAVNSGQTTANDDSPQSNNGTLTNLSLSGTASNWSLQSTSVSGSCAYAPVAMSDYAMMLEDDTLQVKVQENDSDLNGDALTTSIVSGPSNGTVTVLNNDSIEYRPNTDFVGRDTILYRVCDAGSLCDTDTVFIAVVADVVINELDSDDPGADDAEFIELYDGGKGNTPLDSIVVVLYNGADDQSYLPVFDLDGLTTDADGFFLIGGNNVPNIDARVTAKTGIKHTTDSWLQNGADAVAVYGGNATDFPDDSPINTNRLIDAIVYDTDDVDDAALLALYDGAPGTEQVNENGNSNSENESISRKTDGAGGRMNTAEMRLFMPTPGASNNQAPVARTITINTQEDTSAFYIQAQFNDSDPNMDSLITSITVDANNGTTTVADHDSISYVPDADFFGTDSIIYKICDVAGLCDSDTIFIVVDPVNDEPSFVKGADQVVCENSGAHTVNGWATSISTGPANENDQAVTFAVSNDNNSLFSAQPAVNSNGNLTYTLANDASGSTTVTVVVLDNAAGDAPNDSIGNTETFNITINPLDSSSSSLAICQGDSVMLEGSWQSNAGVYRDTLTNVNGCDSIIITTLTVNPVYTTNIDTSICEGDSITLEGAWQTIAGIYRDTLMTVDGCDSIIVTTLSVNPVYSTNVSKAICQGDSLMLEGIWQTSAGVYRDTLSTILGCDSIIVTTLTVNPVYSTNMSKAICQGDSLMLEGIWQTSAGIYRDTLSTISGCDSIIVTTLTVNPVYSTNMSKAICQGDSVMLEGIWQTSAGIYRDTLSSISGCDSIIVTTLTVNPVYNTNVSKTICQGDSIMLEGLWQTANGVYRDTLASISGCDSVIVTNLMVNPVASFDTSMYICEGDSAQINGIWQKVSGIFYDTLTAFNGCDSIITTTLTVSPKLTGGISINNPVTCNGGSDGEIAASVSGGIGSLSYNWNSGETASTITGVSAGDYMVTVTDSIGCELKDSVKLEDPELLVVSAQIDSLAACNGDTTGGATVMVTGGTGTGYQYDWSTGDTTESVNLATGTYYVTVMDSLGCTVTDTLVMISDTSLTVSITPLNTLCTIGAPVTLVATPPGGTFSGNGISGDTFSPGIAGAGQHVVTYTYTDADSCTASDSISINVELCPGIEDNDLASIVGVFPNPTNGDINIMFSERQQNVKIEIRNMLGELIRIMEKDNTQGLDMEISGDPGLYFVTITNHRNEQVIIKVFKN